MKLLTPNTLLQNRYLIVHLIGKGGMGEVYLAVDQRLGSVVALKRTFFSDDVLLGTAFEREARTLARLRHPVLPKVSDHFTENETQYLVMEHISGEDLAERMKTNKKPFPANWVLFWADQLLDALAYLHTHEPPIIHRDIKPQNLKLTAENHIVLLDFGLAKNSLGETRATTSGSIVGYTPHYAPMEQIRGTGTDARSDIYSLSATLYQLLTDVVPNDALTRADAVIGGKPDPLKSINELNPEVSKSVSDVISTGMSLSQDTRYASARLMQKALRDAYAQLQSESIEKTVAFNAPTGSEIPQSKSGSEFNTSPPIISQVPITDLHTQMSVADTGTGNQQPANGYSSQPKNLSTTLQQDSNVSEPIQKQSDIKTEVFSAGSLPEIQSEKQPHAPPEIFNASDNLGKDDYAKPTKQYNARDFDLPENYSAATNAPVFSADNKADEVSAYPGETETEFDSVPQADKFNRPAVDEVDFQLEETIEAKATIQPEKRKNRSAAVIAGIGALFFLVAAASVVGWFMLTRATPSAPEISAPAPTPEATVAVTPMPSPTLEAVTNVNTDIGNETAISDSNGQSNEQANIENQPETGSKTEKPVQIDQPAPARTSTPKPGAQVNTVKAVKPTPQAKPKQTPKGGRTDILQ